MTWCSHCLINCVPDVMHGTMSCPECGKILANVKPRKIKISKGVKKPRAKRIKKNRGRVAHVIAEDLKPGQDRAD